MKGSKLHVWTYHLKEKGCVKMVFHLVTLSQFTKKKTKNPRAWDLMLILTWSVHIPLPQTFRNATGRVRSSAKRRDFQLRRDRALFFFQQNRNRGRVADIPRPRVTSEKFARWYEIFFSNFIINIIERLKGIVIFWQILCLFIIFKGFQDRNDDYNRASSESQNWIVPL